MGSLPAKLWFGVLFPLASGATGTEVLDEPAAFVPRAMIAIAGIANSVAESAAANAAPRGYANFGGLFIAWHSLYRLRGLADGPWKLELRGVHHPRYPIHKSM